MAVVPHGLQVSGRTKCVVTAPYSHELLLLGSLLRSGMSRCHTSPKNLAYISARRRGTKMSSMGWGDSKPSLRSVASTDCASGSTFVLLPTGIALASKLTVPLAYTR
jgi:hypothetical protein